MPARTRKTRRTAPRLVVRELEDRSTPSTFTVTDLGDAGPGTLRQAVLDANAQSGADTIDFQAGLSGTITLTSGQLDLTDDVTITGPGAARSPSAATTPAGCSWSIPA